MSMYQIQNQQWQKTFSQPWHNKNQTKRGESFNAKIQSQLQTNTNHVWKPLLKFHIYCGQNDYLW